jgi:Zn-dependent peptidase ImmA (M78 family)
LKQQYQSPRTVREFAAQCNDVATKVLNDEIDVDKARLYASVARVVAQAVSSEVTRARFVKEEPDLSLEMPDEADV